jgi:hypothetical protein
VWLPPTEPVNTEPRLLSPEYRAPNAEPRMPSPVASAFRRKLCAFVGSISIYQCSRGPTSLTALGAPPPSAAARASRSRRLKAVARSRAATSRRARRRRLSRGPLFSVCRGAPPPRPASARFARAAGYRRQPTLEHIWPGSFAFSHVLLSFRILLAAFRPGAPIIPPPGCVADPHM